MYTYTMPANYPNAAIAGKTLTDGYPTTTKIDGKNVDVLRFVVGNAQVLVRLDNKPELFAQVLADRAAKIQAEANFAASLEGQRQTLAIAEYNSYSPDHFPGSAKWTANQRAINALEAFDAAHPEIIAAINVKKADEADVRYDALSDFVKSGS